MAVFKPIRGTDTKIQNTAIVDGQILISTDTHKIYLDEGTTRSELSPSGIASSTVQNLNTGTSFSSSAQTNDILIEPLSGDGTKVLHDDGTLAQVGLTAMNGGTTAGVLQTTSAGVISAGNVSSSNIDLTTFSGSFADITNLSNTLQYSTTTVTLDPGTYQIVIDASFNMNNNSGDFGVYISLGSYSTNKYASGQSGYYWFPITLVRVLSISTTTTFKIGAQRDQGSSNALLRGSYSIVRIG